MKVKLNKIERGLMKRFSGFSDIERAIITDEIEKKKYHTKICFAIGWTSFIVATPLSMIFKSNNLLTLSLSGLTFIVVGFLFQMLIAMEQWDKTEKNQSKKESCETTSNIQDQNEIDKNELMFTREALEKEMNHES